MLILSRRPGEEIVVITPEGVRIVFHVKEIRRHMGRYGIIAPEDYTILRGEVVDQIDGMPQAQEGEALIVQQAWRCGCGTIHELRVQSCYECQQVKPEILK